VQPSNAAFELVPYPSLKNSETFHISRFTLLVITMYIWLPLLFPSQPHMTAFSPPSSFSISRNPLTFTFSHRPTAHSKHVHPTLSASIENSSMYLALIVWMVYLYITPSPTISLQSFLSISGINFASFPYCVSKLSSQSPAPIVVFIVGGDTFVSLSKLPVLHFLSSINASGGTSKTKPASSSETNHNHKPLHLSL